MATLEPLAGTEYENDPVLPDAISMLPPVNAYVVGLFIAIPAAARLVDVDIESEHCVRLWWPMDIDPPFDVSITHDTDSVSCAALAPVQR